MHPKQKEHLIHQLNEIARKVVDPVLSDKIYHSRIVSAEEMTFIMRGEAYQQYSELGRSLLGIADWENKFSEKYIYHAIDKVLAKILKDGTFAQTEDYLDELLGEFATYAKELTVYVPVSGINMQVDKINIGNIVLCRGTDNFIEDLLGRIKSIIDRGTNTEEDKQVFWEHQKRIINSYKGRVLAEYNVIAEHEKALERAEQECNRIIDLFWYSVPILYPYEERISIGIDEEVPIRPRQIPAISNDNYILNSRWVGAPPFPVNDETIKRMNEIGALEMGLVLKKTPTSITDFERVLLRGIHWYAAGRAQREAENEFINLVICLETFLTPNDRSPIQNTIAEGVALILGNELAERKRFKTRIKSLYGMRSGVSHGGAKAINDADLQWLRLISWHLVRWMIENKSRFDSQKKLMDWLEDKKLE
jgi:hypothetical protein